MKKFNRDIYKHLPIKEARPCPHCGSKEWFDDPTKTICVECGRVHDKPKKENTEELPF